MANQKTASPAKGPDNNRRLAELETGVSALAIALAAARGVKTIGDSNPFELAIDDIGSKQRLAVEVSKIFDHLSANPAAEGVDEPGSFADIMIARLEAAKSAPTEVPATSEQAETLTKRIAELEGQVVALKAENTELNTDLEEAISAKNAAVNELTAIKEGAPPPPAADAEAAGDEVAEAASLREDPRDVGPTFGKCTAKEIRAFIDEGVRFELALSDGEREILAFQPLELASSDLHRVGDRYGVLPAIFAKVSSDGLVGAQEIAGAGLLVHGEQIAYCPLERSLIVNPGEERAFRSTFIFG